MKAIIVPKPGLAEIVDIPMPTIKNPTDVLVKIMYAGICGSDIGIYLGTNSLAGYPRIIGHEFGGIVAEVGCNVKKIGAGDHVAVNPVLSCGNCHACSVGRPNVCTKLEVRGVHRDGGFAEYVVVREQDVHPVDLHKTSAFSLCLAEPYSIGAQICARASIKSGDKMLVMGSGPIGLAAMQTAKALGASVLMTDLLPSRINRALKMGADSVINISNCNLEEEIYSCTRGEGMPVVVDTVCSATSLPLAIRLACAAGTVVCLGLISAPSEISAVEITKKELTIVGSRLNNNRFDDVIRMFETGRLSPQDMVSHVYSFVEINNAMSLALNAKNDRCKIVLQF